MRRTAPPRRPEVTNPARQGPESSTGIAFNIRSLPRCVMPFRFTRSYSERCVRRRAFGKENEPAGAILIGNPLLLAARSQDLALQRHIAGGRRLMCDFSTKEVFHRNPAEDFSGKRIPGNLLPGRRLGRCFLCASRRFSGGSWSFRCSGTRHISRRRRWGRRSWTCRRSDSFSFLLARREKRGSGQNADVFLHSWKRTLLQLTNCSKRSFWTA